MSLGLNSEARSNNAVAIGNAALASAIGAMAIGTSANASHSNSLAIGPPDDAGTAATTTDTNQIRIGTSRHRISVPGLYESPRETNSQFAGTNIFRGSVSYPAFALATLAAGNNISVPFGTNVYVRCNSGPASAATICGIIGGATSGGLDGQLIELFNDTGFGLTFAVNTVDPVAANRINTPLGTDVTIADQASARLRYDGTDSRWQLISPFSVTASATNAVASIWTNGVVVSSAATNVNLFPGSNVVLSVTNNSGKVDVQISAIGPSVPPFLFAITNDVIITNQTGSISVLSNLLGTKTLPANFWQPGMRIEIDLFGKYFMAGGALNQSNEVFYGASLLATNTMPYFAASGDAWSAHLTITCRTIGASGSLYCQGFTELPSTAGGVSGVTKPIRLVSGAVTVDTTASTALDYKFNPGATTTALHIHAGVANVLR